MSGTMMQHGAKVPIATFQFKSLVLFSSEKRFTLSLTCFVPIRIGNEQGSLMRNLMRALSSPWYCRFFQLNSLVLQPK